MCSRGTALVSEKRFNPALAGRLDNPERLQWLAPAEVIAEVSVREGEVIADIGAGTGYFSLPMTAHTGPSGRIYAIDAQQEMLNVLRDKLTREPAANIELVNAEADSTGLPDRVCDLVFLANVWHEFSSRSAVLAEAARILKAGGRIAILDWRPDAGPEHGPPLGHRIGVTSAIAELTTAGFANLSHCNIGRYSWLVQGTVLPK